VWAGVRKLSEGSGGGLIAELSVDSTTNNGSFYTFTFTDSKYYWRNRGTSNVQISSSSITAPVTNLFTGINDISAPVETLRINGSQVATSTTTQGTGNYGNYPLYIGARGGSSLFFNGNLYSLIIRGAQTSDAQIINAETWVNQKTKAYTV
jgi:hypothetical protein